MNPLVVSELVFVAGIGAVVAHKMRRRRAVMRFAARVVAFCDERHPAIHAAMRCPCGGLAVCPRTRRLEVVVDDRHLAMRASLLDKGIDNRHELASLALDALRHYDARWCRAEAIKPLRYRLAALVPAALATDAVAGPIMASVVGEFWRGPS